MTIQSSVRDPKIGPVGQTKPMDRRWTTIAAIAGGALAMALLAIPIYWKSVPGGPPEPVPAAPAPRGHGGQAPADFAAMAERLAAKLAANPDDARGWALLGRSYLALGRYEESVIALRRAVDGAPGNADAWADLADALVMANGRRWNPEAARAVAGVLAAAPDHDKGLWLAGTEAYERGDYRAALRHWEHLQRVAAPDSGIREDVAASIAEARSRLGKGKTR